MTKKARDRAKISWQMWQVVSNGSYSSGYEEKEMQLSSLQVMVICDRIANCEILGYISLLPCYYIYVYTYLYYASASYIHKKQTSFLVQGWQGLIYLVDKFSLLLIYKSCFISFVSITNCK